MNKECGVHSKEKKGAELRHEVVAGPLDQQSCDGVAGHGQCEAMEAVSMPSFIQNLSTF